MLVSWSLATIVAAWALPVLAAPPAPAAKAVPRAGQALPREAWFDFNFYGNKVGFLFSRDERTELEGKPALHAHRWSVVSVRRQSDSMRMESTTDAWFEADGTPLRFRHQRLEGKEKRSVEGYRDGEVLVLRQDTGGNLRTQRIPLAGLRLASSLEVLYGEALASTGAKTPKWEGKALDESDGEVKSYTIAVTGTEQALGAPALVLAEALGKVESRSFVRADGEVVRTELAGIGAEFVKTTREKATALGESVDIFSSAMFPVPVRLPRGDDLERLVVRLGSKSKRAVQHLTDRRQQAKVLGPSAIELTASVDPLPRKVARRPIREARTRAFLAETPYEALGDERLRAVVAREVAPGLDAWEAARRLNAFVHRHITKKSLARAFATAVEALETREGDCTEHAVLFSALAKIAGIPTKLITGLVYVDGPNPVFGYHEWVEVWTGHAWVAMDPTFGQDLADPTHLKFTEGLSDAEGLRDAGMAAASLIGDLTLEVVSYTTTGGKTVRP